jgi:two-component system cell cycle sensor histidine kinase/response regulator CckA
MANIRILIAEDENIVAMEMANRLQALGYAVIGQTQSGEQAIALVKELSPDLVLMDIHLGGEMDGIGAAEVITQRFGVPVIYVTGYADDVTLQRAKLTEPHGFLTKPFVERELHSAIQMALHKHDIERKLKENEQWLSATLNSIGDAVIATDAGGRIKHMNPMAETMTGWRRAHTLGIPLDKVLRVVAETGDETLDFSMPALQASEFHIIDPAQRLLLVDKDGQKRPASISGTRIRDELDQVAGWVFVIRDFATQRKLEEELVKTRELETLALMSDRLARELEQRVQQRTAELQQANERLSKEMAERQRAEQILIQTERLTVMGKLAASMAHEINNPLQSIAGFLDLAQQELAEGQDITGYLRIAHEEVRRMIETVDQMRELGSSKTAKKDTVNLNDLLGQILALTKNQCLMANVEVLWEPDSALPAAQVVSDQMKQVFLNVIFTALEAMPQGGQLRVGTAHAAEAPGEIVVTVSDQGQGITAHDLTDAFEPFFNTKPYGMGLGMSISYDIVRKHGGAIQIDSQAGEGTTFKISLPALPDHTLQASSAEQEEQDLR